MTKKRSTWLKIPLKPEKAVHDHTFFIGILASQIVTETIDKISSNEHGFLISQKQPQTE